MVDIIDIRAKLGVEIFRDPHRQIARGLWCTSYLLPSIDTASLVSEIPLSGLRSD